jgi:hypothetical protein
MADMTERANKERHPDYYLTGFIQAYCTAFA